MMIVPSQSKVVISIVDIALKAPMLRERPRRMTYPLLIPFFNPVMCACIISLLCSCLFPSFFSVIPPMHVASSVSQYRRIGLHVSGAHSLFSAHYLLGACCLLDKICLDPRQEVHCFNWTKIWSGWGEITSRASTRASENEDHFCHPCFCK